MGAHTDTDRPTAAENPSHIITLFNTLTLLLREKELPAYQRKFEGLPNVCKLSLVKQAGSVPKYTDNKLHFYVGPKN